MYFHKALSLYIILSYTYLSYTILYWVYHWYTIGIPLVYQMATFSIYADGKAKKEYNYYTTAANIGQARHERHGNTDSRNAVIQRRVWFRGIAMLCPEHTKPLADHKSAMHGISLDGR